MNQAVLNRTLAHTEPEGAKGTLSCGPCDYTNEPGMVRPLVQQWHSC